jgi:hypothetical protein
VRVDRALRGCERLHRRRWPPSWPHDPTLGLDAVAGEYGEPGSGSRAAGRPASASDNRKMVPLPLISVPNLIQGSLFAIARDDDVTFGILNSRFHDLWATRQGNRLGVGNQRRYNITRTFETYPFPEGLTPDISMDLIKEHPSSEPIIAAARRLDELRNKWLNPADLTRNEPEVVTGFPDRILPKTVQAAVVLRDLTLTRLYNNRPEWLVAAHRDLDRAVAAAYGWNADISDESSLAALLELNAARGIASLDRISDMPRET